MGGAPYQQYRCPEVIIGSKYDTSADMWSFACIIFEMLTGDLLFDPRAGEGYEREAVVGGGYAPSSDRSDVLDRDGN